MKHRQLSRGPQPTIDNLAGALLADSHPCYTMHDIDKAFAAPKCCTIDMCSSNSF